MFNLICVDIYMLMTYFSSMGMPWSFDFMIEWLFCHEEILVDKFDKRLT